jgi:hypothetical protein
MWYSPAVAYTVGGTIQGLTATIVLRLNSSTFHIYPANSTTFKFDTQLNTGDAYNVAVGIQPAGASCKVSNGLGVMGTANVTNIAITCTPYGSAVLTWTKPTLNTDGSTLTDLAGYILYYGTDPTLAVSTSRLIFNPDTLTTTISTLPLNQKYYFSIASRSTSGGVGPRSSIASKQL